MCACDEREMREAAELVAALVRRAGGTVDLDASELVLGDDAAVVMAEVDGRLRVQVRESVPVGGAD